VDETANHVQKKVKRRRRIGIDQRRELRFFTTKLNSLTGERE